MTKSKKKRITNTVRFIILAIYLLIVLLPMGPDGHYFIQDCTLRSL